MRLSECKEGFKAVVKDLFMNESIRKRMMDLGLLPGTEVAVVRKAPFGGPMVVQFRGYQISFRLSEAKHILIEAV
ncbi:ferrous iron transport protein A [Tumebacillus sp. ITR2]|uniref:Ferrous iron transport protein A n=1 Tax=Tumebacillus amylolyticus TaxID=2801339 RepID=A0ABS1J962_9BACL|nr:FeoA family protein [Tumebacillus amylolyticus]MBL0386822.1 ferrous iron transport protein A [Tumebacillus amylolyticus]